MATYATKWNEIILVTPDNRDSLIWYKFKELTTEELVLYEKQELEKCWYIVEIIDWCCIRANTDESNKYEIKLKLNRMKEIREDLVKLWFTAELPDDPRIVDELEAKRVELQNEWDTIKAEVDSTYEATLINDVISSFFS